LYGILITSPSYEERPLQGFGASVATGASQGEEDARAKPELWMELLPELRRLLSSPVATLAP